MTWRARGDAKDQQIAELLPMFASQLRFVEPYIGLYLTTTMSTGSTAYWAGWATARTLFFGILLTLPLLLLFTVIIIIIIIIIIIKSILRQLEQLATSALRRGGKKGRGFFTHPNPGLKY